MKLFILSALSGLFFVCVPGLSADPIPREILQAQHPRIFLTDETKKAVKRKINGRLEPVYRLLTRSKNKNRTVKIPARIVKLKDFIYKEAFLYQVSGDKKHAQNVIKAMEKYPSSIENYGGGNNRYGHAIEALSIGFDWCYDHIVEKGKKDFFVQLINSYMEGNLENLKGLPDFHNYASQGQFAILAAGLATYGDNDKAYEFVDLARRVFEFGEDKIRKGVIFNVRRSIEAVKGTSNWEGVTYSRRTLFNYMKYCQALNTATNGKINPWNTSFKSLENAGYYIMYSLRPDNLFESLGDVNWPGIMYFDINNMALLQSTFKNKYFTAFINKYYRIIDNRFETEIRIPGSKTPLTFYLLWFDPDIGDGDLDELPNAMRFGGTVIIRSGFTPRDTFITFKSGYHWGFHSQLDHGSFTIYKDSPLVIDSGFYDSWKWGKRHNWNYWKRTVAHNTLIVYNKKDKLINYPKKYTRKLVNDGGQRFAFMRFDPPNKSHGYSNGLLSIDDLENRRHQFKMGEIKSYEGNDEYVYIKTDLTNAYSNKYSGKGKNPAKRVSSVIRNFVYLQSDYIIIYDQIKGLSKEFEKRWLLHSGDYLTKDGKPVVKGSSKILHGTDDAGITEFENKDFFTLKNKDGNLSAKILLPEKNIVRRIGGTDYEFWVNGENHPLSKIPKNRDHENPGAWRMEVSRKDKSKDAEFLVVIKPSLLSENDLAKIVQVAGGKNYVQGVKLPVENRYNHVFFLDTDTNPKEIFEFESDGRTILENCIFLGLKPDTYYRVSIENHNSYCRLKLKEGRGPDERKSSQAGSIVVHTKKDRAKE